VDFLRSGEITFFENGVELTRSKLQIENIVIVGTRTDAQSFRSQVGMGSESDCLFGQFERILWILDAEAYGVCGRGVGSNFNTMYWLSEVGTQEV